MWPCLLLASLLAGSVSGQSRSPLSEFDSLLARGKQLIEEQNLPEAERVLRQILEKNPEHLEAIFLLGLTLAKQEKWAASRERLEQAITQQPDFLPARLELAGVHFKMGNRRESIRTLRQVLARDPSHQYAHTFLATLLYLEGHRIEALYHWNRGGEPRIDQIAYNVPSQTTADFLQHLFPLNEGEMLRREQVLDIHWKQQQFRLGSAFHWQLQPGRHGAWDLEIGLSPGTALSYPKALLLENSTRALLYQEVAVDYPRTPRSGKHYSGSARWDTPRKRFQTSAAFPFLSSSSDGLHLGFDFREENWSHTASGSEFFLQSEQLLVHYEYLMSSRKSFSIHTGYQHQFSRAAQDSQEFPDSPHLLRLGLGWNHLVSLNHADTMQLDWWTRFDTIVGIGGQNNRARQFSSTAKLNWHWSKRSRSGMKLAFGTGVSSQALPIFDYFILGVGQDQPLPLRAHPTVQNGRKGHAPMGRNFALAQSGDLPSLAAMVAYRDQRAGIRRYCLSFRDTV